MQKGQTGSVIAMGMDVVTFINNLVTWSQSPQHLDVLIETPDGNIGTTGQGIYINDINDSWASGNNFNDTQLFVMPAISNYTIVVNATRATQKTEYFNFTVGFVSPVDKKTSIDALSGSIQQGQSIIYQVTQNSSNLAVTEVNNNSSSPKINQSSPSYFQIVIIAAVLIVVGLLSAIVLSRIKKNRIKRKS